MQELEKERDDYKQAAEVLRDEVKRLQAEIKRLKGAAGHPKDDGPGG